jgi:hypothetical protein
MQRMVAVIARWGLWIALGLALLVRIAVLIAIPQPMVSDALAYFHMADGAAHGQPMTDIFGQYAFYSPGYPLLLAGPFAGFGSTLLVAQVVNLLCALGLIALAWLLTKRLSRSALAPPLAALALAVWLPSVLGAQIVEKENLSSLLLIGYTGASRAPGRGGGADLWFQLAGWRIGDADSRRIWRVLAVFARAISAKGWRYRPVRAWRHGNSHAMACPCARHDRQDNAINQRAVQPLSRQQPDRNGLVRKHR